MIRLYRPDDLDALLDLWLAASTQAHPFLPESFHREGPALIRDVYLPKAETWVYERNGRLAGFIALLGEEVGALFVDPACHGQGLGRALLDHARTLRPTLHLEVFKENTAARRFYSRYGFIEVGERPHEHLGHILVRVALPHEA